MKNFWYFVGVLALALGMSYTTYQYFTPMLKITDANVQISVLQDFWQFLLLGFVIGGVFFTIPGKNSRIQFGASLCVLASCIFLVFFGIGIMAQNTWFRYPIMGALQIGMTSFYAGIAVVMIELTKNIFRELSRSLQLPWRT